jgi:hypothetical protein
VIVAFWAEDTAPAVAWKVAEVAFAATVTEAGTVRALVEVESATAAPAAPAAFESVTVHVVLVFAVRLEAAHCKDETVALVAPACNFKGAVCEEPFRDAVTAAASSA